MADWLNDETTDGVDHILYPGYKRTSRLSRLSTASADVEVWGEGVEDLPYQFEVIEGTNTLVVHLAGNDDVTCPIPDTWEEAKAWMRMVSALHGWTPDERE